MPADRFYIDAPFQDNQTLQLSGSELEHFFVMRIKTGEMIEVVNGRNQLASCEVSQIHKNYAALHVKELYTSKKQKPSIILVQALTKMNKLEYILEKGVELEVTEFWLFPGHHSEIEEISENKKKRLEMLCIAAMKQCGRLDFPKTVFYTSMKEMDFKGDAFFGDTRANAPGLIQTLKKNASKSAILCIGPEKGFHSGEVQMMESKKAKGISLLDTTLRAETAAICAASLTAHYLYLMNSVPNIEPL